MNGEVIQGRQIDVRRGVGALAEHFVKRIKGGEQAWNMGLGEVVKAAIAESDLPSATSPVELARKLGILQPLPVVKNPGRRVKR